MRGLLFHCRPLAVAWFVVAVIVDAVQCELCSLADLSRWPAPHIGNKILEFEPSLANFYSACTVTLICSIAWIQATAFHANPRSIFRTWQASPPVTVGNLRQMSRKQYFAPKATA